MVVLIFWGIPCAAHMVTGISVIGILFNPVLGNHEEIKVL